MKYYDVELIFKYTVRSTQTVHDYIQTKYIKMSSLGD